MTIVDLIVHAAPFVASIPPLFIFQKIYRESKGEFTNAFTMLFLSFVPLTIFHMLESLREMGYDFLPPEGTLAYDVVSHGVVVIVLLALTWFFLWFYQKFVLPFKVPQKKGK